MDNVFDVTVMYHSGKEVHHKDKTHEFLTELYNDPHVRYWHLHFADGTGLREYPLRFERTNDTQQR